MGWGEGPELAGGGLNWGAGDRHSGGCVVLMEVVVPPSRCLRLGLNMNEGPRFLQRWRLGRELLKPETSGAWLDERPPQAADRSWS